MPTHPQSQAVLGVVDRAAIPREQATPRRRTRSRLHFTGAESG